MGIGLPASVFEDTKSRLFALGSRVELSRFDDAHGLVKSLLEGEIDAAIRGMMNSVESLRELRSAFRVDQVMRTALLEDYSARPFLLAPVGIDEGTTYDSRLSLVQHTLRYFSSIGWRLDVGILSKGRIEDKNRGNDIKESIVEGAKMAEQLTSEGHNARHFAILVEDAVKKSELVVAPDGVTGNLMFRTLHFVGGRKAYGAPVVNIPKVFIDTSRAKTDFTDAVLLGAGLFKNKSG